MIEVGLIAFLGANAGVTAIVGNRITQGYAPQGQVRPALTMNRVSNVRSRGVGGYQGVTRSRVQVNCWGGTGTGGALTAKQLSEACRKALDPPGGLVNVAMGAYFVQAAWPDGDRDMSSSPQHAEGAPDSGVSFDVTLAWQER